MNNNNFQSSLPVFEVFFSHRSSKKDFKVFFFYEMIKVYRIKFKYINLMLI